jgi:hypothetical protein
MILEDNMLADDYESLGSNATMHAVNFDGEDGDATYKLVHLTDVLSQMSAEIRILRARLAYLEARNRDDQR